MRDEHMVGSRELPRIARPSRPHVTPERTRHSAQRAFLSDDAGSSKDLWADPL